MLANQSSPEFLARLELITVSEASADTPESAATLVGDMEILSPMTGLTGRERTKLAENRSALERLAQQIGKIRSL